MRIMYAVVKVMEFIVRITRQHFPVILQCTLPAQYIHADYLTYIEVYPLRQAPQEAEQISLQ